MDARRILLCLVTLLSVRDTTQQAAVEINWIQHPQIMEDVPMGYVVETVTDKTNGAVPISSITYDGNDYAFSVSKVNSTAWNIILNQPLDYESRNTFAAHFTASGVTEIYPMPFTIVIHVLDVNDNAPQFINLPYNAQVDEDARNGTMVFNKTHATDRDGFGSNSVVRYEFEPVIEGSDSFSGSLFIMDPSTGWITLNGPLDYEQRTFYHYNVTAYDLGTPRQSSFTDLFITVRDVQDTTPVFLYTPYVTSVPETTNVGSTVLTVKAIDGDRAVSKHFYYSITHSTCDGLFSLDRVSGTLTVAADLDYEQPRVKNQTGRCDITIQATEQQGSHSQEGNYTATATASVTITDVNDNAPVFDVTTVVANLDENSPVGSLLQLPHDIAVTDADSGINSQIFLSVTSDGDAFELMISDYQSRGTVLLRVKTSPYLDYEQRNIVHIRITATDGTHASTNNATVTVTINNVNEYSPQFNQPSYSATVPEGSPAGTVVAHVRAMDPDSADFGNINYTLSDSTVFHIDPYSGDVTLTSSDTDRERLDRYSNVLITATDGGGRSQTVPLTVTFSDVNDNSPVFSRDLYESTLTEETTSLSRSVVVQATDADQANTENSRVTYELIGTTPAGLESHFGLNSNSGNLIVLKTLDYDTIPWSSGQNGVVTLHVRASDHGTPSLSSTVDINIVLIDINDHAPVFDHNSLSISVTIPENGGSNVRVASVHATDNDGSSPNRDLTYIIANGANDQFHIDSNNGDIHTTHSLDRETTAAYSLTVNAVDRGTPANTATITVTISVNDTNDTPPKFPQAEITMNHLEAGRAVQLYRFNATDEDLNSHLVYSINWNSSSGLDENQIQVSRSILEETFMIVGGTNVLRTGLQSLDREKLEWAKLVIQVKDEDSHTGEQTATMTLYIQVQDVDDNSPVFVDVTNFVANVTENAPAGTSLQLNFPMTVRDIDKGENAAIRLSLSNYSDCLEVFPNTARSLATLLIRVTNPSCFDYEHVQSMQFTVIATGAVTAIHTSSATVHLDIMNINDNSPVFTVAAPISSIPEDSNTNTHIYTMTAADGDLPPYNTVTYSLQGGDGAFKINSRTGEVRVATRSLLDYETRQVRQVTVVAEDGDERRAESTLTVKLTDVNDNSPQFLRPEYRAFLGENTTQFSSDFVVQAVDADSTSPNNVVTYSLSPSTWSSHFSVDTHTGRVTVRSAIDYEQLAPHSDGVITLLVLATDGGLPHLTGSVNITIIVQDANDNSPIFNPTSYSGTVQENLHSGAWVAQVHASDSDGSSPNKDVSYMIASGGGDNFRIDSSNGNITTTNSLDREKTSTYNLIVLAVDRGSPPNTASTTVTVNVLNVNDDPPVFLQDHFTVTVTEEQQPGTALFNVTAKDGDEDALLSYTPVWHQCVAYKDNENVSLDILKAAMTVDNRTGTVSVKSRLDREIMDRAVLVVFVEDLHAARGTTQSATATVSILVGDTNDNSPTFNLNNYAATVDENPAEGTVLKLASGQKISVTDPDLDQNSVFNISVDDAHADIFRAEPETARSLALVQIRVLNGASLDYETEHSLTFTITARETQSLQHRSSTTTITLNINDMNDNYPVFSNTNYSIDVTENSPQGTSVAQIMATDADSGAFGNVTYYLEGDVERFSIHPVTGIMTTADQLLNREVKDTYLMTLVAKDGGGQRTAVPVTVTVIDKNDETPTFRETSYSARVMEDSLGLDPPVTVTATDNDKPGTPQSNVTYYLASCEPVPCANFSLDAISGVLTLTSRVDYEQIKETKVVVGARDQGSPPLSSNVTVNIHIEPKSGHGQAGNCHHGSTSSGVVPVFKNETISTTVRENSGPNVHVVKVHANDSNNDLIYTIASGAGDHFQIDSSSGDISTTHSLLDRETTAAYTLTVVAMEIASRANTAATTVTISVSDVNDEPPTFPQAEVFVKTTEEGPGAPILTLNAHDADLNPHLAYSIDWDASIGLDVDHNAVSRAVLQESFVLFPNSDVVRAGFPHGLDRETVDTAILTILATDVNSETGPQTATMLLHVDVLDRDDNPPTFGNVTSFVANMTENSSFGTTLWMNYAMTVHDIDKDENAAFHLSLTNFEHCLEVFPSTGRSRTPLLIMVTDPSCLDFQSRRSVDFSVIATGDVNPLNTASASVHLNILTNKNACPCNRP